MSPAGETGTSFTPQRANASGQCESKIEYTPNSRGASVISENVSLVDVQIKEVQPWIQRDIEQAKQCKADAMLQALLQRASCAPETKQPELLQKCLKGVLPVCNGQVSAGGMSSSGIEISLKEYVRSGIENDFYSPFIDATNIALACLEEIKIDRIRASVSTVDMICQKNGMPMYQTHQTVRSPDVIIFPLNSAWALFEDEKGGKKGKQKDDEKGNTTHDEKHDTKRKAHIVKNAKEKLPASLPWKDVLACIEFKRKTPGRTKGIKPPSSSYTSTDYVPTKAEYLPVNHSKAEVHASDPSQIPATQPVSDTASGQSSGLAAAQPFKGGSSSKRKAADTLQSAAKKLKVNPDRQGTVQSSGINFIQDLPRFMVLLFVLQRFEVHDWGRNKNFLPVQVEGKQCHEFKIKDEDLGTVDLLVHTSHDERVTHYGLQGRATNVVPVTSEALTKKYGNFEDGMVAKIFWGEADRTSEPEILKKVGTIAKRHATIRDHVPELLWHHTFTNPTSAIREALDVPEPTIGSRVLCVLVFRKLKSITELHGHELFDAWYQCISCHLTLWKEGVYHRDASPGNMMWYKKNRKLIGVLNDYDLSALADDPRPRGNQRTGTVPFMALDLLTAKAQRGNVKHLYRHDLESFVWVFTWISFRYDNGALLPTGLRPIDQWATLDAVSCGEKKQSFVNYLEDFRPSHIKTVIWCFILACFQVLDTEAFNRRKRRRELLIQADGLDEEINDVDEESVSDMDDLLGKFTGNIAWVKLSNAFHSQ